MQSLLNRSTESFNQSKNMNMTNIGIFTAMCVLCAAFWRVHAVAGWLSVLYYKGIFLASMLPFSSHPVSFGLCTHTETKKKSKEGEGGVGGSGGGGSRG